MGGHGALTIALKNPEKYKSVSAFSPIVAPTQNEWGQKAFTGYLGEDKENWLQYDACELIKRNPAIIKLFVDQGTNDEFLEKYLQTEKLKNICEKHGHELQLRMLEGYDHSYYFITSFIEDHIRYHAEYLNL